MRKFIKIQVVSTTMYALCDDGTIWQRINSPEWPWEFVGSAPQDEPEGLDNVLYPKGKP